MKAVVPFHDPIWNEHVMAFFARCQSAMRNGATTIHVDMSSIGGNIYAAERMALYLQLLPVQLHIHNSGQVSSAAVAVFLAPFGLKTAAPSASFYLHGFEIDKDRLASMRCVRAWQFKRKATRFGAEWYVSQCVRSTRIPEARLRTVLNGKASDWNMGAEEALRLGVIHQVVG